MFVNRQKIRESWETLAGIYPSNDPSLPTITPSLTNSDNGFFVNEVHELITTENIYQSLRNFDQYHYPTYSPSEDSTGTYIRGSKVAFQGINYEYVNSAASSGNAPPNTTYWRQIDEFSDYLIRTRHNAIDRVLNAYKDLKTGQKNLVKSLVNNLVVFQGSATADRLEPNNNRLVGIRIRFKKNEKHLLAVLNKIGTQFNETLTGIPLYLYHDSQLNAPIATFSINHATPLNYQWTSLTTNNELRFDDSAYLNGGDFYIGYKQSELVALSSTAQALSLDLYLYDYSYYRNTKWSKDFQELSKYIAIAGFEVEESQLLNGGTGFADTDRIIIQGYKNYGLNLGITVKQDLTDFMVNQKDQAENAVNQMWGMVLLEGIANNTRNGLSDRIRAMAKEQIMYHKDTEGSLVAINVKRALKSLSFDFSGLNNSSLPSDSKRTLNIKVKTM